MTSPQFRFNPITGQLDLSDDHGTGPGGNIDITADEGGTISAQVFSMLGKMAGSANVMTTLLEAGILNWENRSWETPYVVDPSTTPGLRGTFETIQAALDAAVLDGMTFSNPKKILIRPDVSYAENLVIPGGAYFEAMGYASDVQAFSPAVTIVGNHTLADICLWASNGIQWQCAAGKLITAGATFAICLARNSNFYNSGTGLIFDFSTGTTAIDWYDCTFNTGLSNFGTAILIDDLNANSITNCKFNGVGIQVNGGLIRMENNKDVGELNLNGADTFIRDTNFAGALNDNIYGSGGATLVNCGFNNNDGTKYACSCASGALMINCYLWTNASVPADLLSPAINMSPGFGQSGNILRGHRFNGSGTYQIDANGESYVGLTATTINSVVSLRRGPSGATTPMTDYQVWVVDEAGTAGTNSIEVVDADGALINGAASFVIDQNFGAVLFHTNGTDWFAIASNISASANITLTPDNGGPISGVAFNVLGGQAGTVPVMETENDTGDLKIFNNAYETQYVVDPNSTPGLKGTFQTLQAALDQAAADGMTNNNPRKIYVRVPTLTEDVTFKNGAMIVGQTITNPQGAGVGVAPVSFTRIVGNHTFDAAVIMGIQNIILSTPNTDPIMSFTAGSVLELFCENCWFIDLNGAKWFDFTVVGTTLKLTRCSFSFSGTATDICATTTDVVNLTIDECNFYSAGTWDSENSAPYCINSSDLPCFNTGLGGTIAAQNCTFNTGANYCVDADGARANTGDIFLYNCNFNGYGVAAVRDSFRYVYADAIRKGLTAQSGSVTLQPLYEPGVIIRNVASLLGNVLPTHRIDLTGQYTTTLGDVILEVVTLPTAQQLNIDSTQFDIDMIMGVYDATGTAGTNNITVDFTGSSGTLNGSGTYVISENYGGLLFKCVQTTPSIEFIILNEIQTPQVNTFTSLTVNGPTIMNGAQIVKFITTAIDYNVLITDYGVGVTSTAAPRSIVLPTTGSTAGQSWEIKDQSGNAAVNNITITAEGGALIDGVSSLVINGNYQGWTIRFDGTNFWTR